MITANISELKARLSHYLRVVRRGETVTVTDRGRPVAEIAPVAAARGMLETREARFDLRDFDSALSPLPVDSLAALLEERQVER
jgi:prevent-host-death family protein